MVTITLYDYIRSELIKKGQNEFKDEQGKLTFFDEDAQFMTKILQYDEDVADIVNRLFTGVSLNQRVYDEHFKKNFLYRFVSREINRQTIEAFRLELLSTFLSNESFINRLYEDGEKYVTQTATTDQSNKQTSEQVADGSTMTDNRQAYADLPQNNVQIDVDNTVMKSASDNTISRNKQENRQQTDGETSGESHSENKIYQLDELFKTNGLLEQVLNIFDEKCFLQVW